MSDGVNAPSFRPLSPDGAGTRLRGAVVAAAVVGWLLASGIALWAHFGVAAFHEMILVGLATCF